MEEHGIMSLLKLIFSMEDSNLQKSVHQNLFSSLCLPIFLAFTVIKCSGKYDTIDLLATPCESLERNLPARGNGGKCWTHEIIHVIGTDSYS